MILRALALLCGVPLFLIGLLATVLAIGMVGDPAPQGGPPPIAAQVIVAILMVGVTAAGAALCWLGVRRRAPRRTAEASPAENPPAGQITDTFALPQETAVRLTAPAYALPTVAAATGSPVATIQPSATLHESFGHFQDQGDFHQQFRQQLDSLSPADDDDEPFRIGTTGQLVGKCGPNLSGQLHYYVIGGLVIAVGLAIMIWLQIDPGAANPVTAGKVGLWLGGGLILFGGAMIGLQLTRVPQVISLYDNRLEIASGDKLRTVRLDHIADLHLQEFYEHRFAPRTFAVTLHVNGDRSVTFSTALGGDADLIVRCLADIATNVEVRQFAG